MGVNKSMKQAIFLWTTSLDWSVKKAEAGETEKRKSMQRPWRVKNNIQDDACSVSAATRPWTHINSVLINIWRVSVVIHVSRGENGFWRVRDYLRTGSSEQGAWSVDLSKVLPQLFEWIFQESELVMIIQYIKDDRFSQIRNFDDNTVYHFQWDIDKRYMFQLVHIRVAILLVYGWAWLIGGLFWLVAAMSYQLSILNIFSRNHEYHVIFWVWIN